MDKKHDSLLSILANLDEKMIDVGSEQRAKWISGIKNARLRLLRTLSFTSAAAIFLIVIVLSVFKIYQGTNTPGMITPPSPDKQVPVYQGMTVSLTPEHLSLKTVNDTVTLLSTDDISLQTDTYYVPQNANFYITVHLSNPDQFEIISFTLNDKKYTSYMFEEGSDMENIILKCNAGDVIGTFEYTIDAIKYIDGTEIKNAVIAGDQTVNVCVYSEIRPTLRLESGSVGYSDYRNDLTIDDPNAFLENKTVTANLYEDGNLVRSLSYPFAKTIPLHFTDLRDRTAYTFEIVISYDAMDGKGTVTYIPIRQNFTTESAVTLSMEQVTLTEASFLLDAPKDDPDFSILTLSVYKDGVFYKKIDANERTVTGLLSSASYTLRADYMLGEYSLCQSVDFQTQMPSVPSVSLGAVNSTLDSVSFVISVEDPQALITDSQTELLSDANTETVIRTQNGLDLRSFEGLDAPKSYILRITYTYDLMDGSAPATHTVTKSFITQSKGLKIENGKVEGIGSCTDTVLYINMPIGNSAFTKNTNIQAVYLGASCTSIGSGAFTECRSRTNVYRENGLRSIDFSAFVGCSSLQSLHFPATLRSIGNNAFSGCSGLKSVVFEEGIREIGNYVFNICTDLTDVHLPDSLTKIGDGAFMGCSLRSVYVPGGVTSIGEYAFVSTIAVYTPVSARPSDWSELWKGEETLVYWNVQRD